MVEIIELIRAWILEVIETFGYAAIFFFMLVENLFPPMPSEIVMPFAGFKIAENQLSLFWTVVAGTLGAATGALIFYYIGKIVGRERMNRWISKYGKYLLLENDDLDRALAFFDKHGKQAVLFGRLLPGIRTLISIPAGMNNMPILSFLGLTLIGSAAWNLILATSGILLGKNWDRVIRVLETYQALLWLAFFLLIGVYVWSRLKRR